MVAPVSVKARNGKVSELELTRMQLGQFDRSGRKRPEPIKGSEFTVQVDTVICAISQEADLDFLSGDRNVETSRGRIRVNRALRTANPKVWAGGDAITGPAMVIDAIRAGRDAARRIDEAIREANGEKPWVAPTDGAIDIPFEIDEELVERPQARMPQARAIERRKDFREVELGYTLKLAAEEARRCMRCDMQVE
jgi:NADH-quinone oxidoreductase subunit F